MTDKSKCERRMKAAAYATIAGLLMLVTWGFWVSDHPERADPLLLLSDKTAAVMASVCAVIAYVAVGGMVFIAIRAFYLGLTEPEPKDRHDRSG